MKNNKKMIIIKKTDGEGKTFETIVSNNKL